MDSYNWNMKDFDSLYVQNHRIKTSFIRNEQNRVCEDCKKEIGSSLSLVVLNKFVCIPCFSQRKQLNDYYIFKGIKHNIKSFKDASLYDMLQILRRFKQKQNINFTNIPSLKSSQKLSQCYKHFNKFILPQELRLPNPIQTPVFQQEQQIQNQFTKMTQCLYDYNIYQHMLAQLQTCDISSLSILILKYKQSLQEIQFKKNTLHSIINNQPISPSIPYKSLLSQYNTIIQLMK